MKHIIQHMTEYQVKLPLQLILETYPNTYDYLVLKLYRLLFRRMQIRTTVVYKCQNL